jgi:Na+:H+ antiporter, NhaA family
MAHTRSKLAPFIFDNSLLLLAGTIAAVVWANLDLGSYDRMTHPLHFWVNDVGMGVLLRTGCEGGLRGEVAGTARIPASGDDATCRGWAIPCATDIAFSAMIARVIFPRGHP